MSEENGKQTEGEAEGKSWVEDFEVAGEKLVEQVKKWAADTSVRRIRVKAPDGDVAVDIPLTVGGLVGGVVVIAAPVLAVLGALAVFVAKLDVEIVHEEVPASEDIVEGEATDTTPDA